MRERLWIEVAIFCCLFGLILVARYLFAPLRLRRTHWLATDVESQPIDSNQRQPEKVEAYLKRVAEALRPEGFEVVGDYALTNFTNRVAGLNRILVNRAKRTAASVIINFLQKKSGEWEINQSVIAIRTDFADGSQLITSNFKLINAVPPRPEVRTYRFVRVRNPQILVGIHEAMLDRFHDGKRRDFPLDSRFGGDATAFMRSQMAEELERYVAAGYYYEDEADKRLRLTLKGAYLSVWKNSWPWKEIRYQKREREATRMLKQLGMDYEGRKRKEAGEVRRS